ncbi:MAG: hypothetical protein Q4D94_07765 [Bacillota bacterium]|nr:hypothetical protein [Bacillota bacterium]
MIELDFLFIYEHKVRELEALCLMKYELDRRGYQTKIVYVDDAVNAAADTPIYHAKVLCTMACYDNYTLFWHSKEFVKFEKVIDLQWENIVYPKDEQREDAYKNYWGIGKDVVHVSWGQQNVKRLLEAAHLDEKKVKLTGHVGMDFLRAPLDRYYLSREEVLAKYDIPLDKKVILFASPYYGDCLSEKYIAGMRKAFGDDWGEYYKFMCDSQKEVLKWFEKICTEYPDIILIFRPHPGHPSLMAEKLAERCDNFRIISGESVKQWIVACDKIYTGNSSVVVEAYFAKKMCQLLFPFSTTPGYELQLIADSSKIRTYEEFQLSICNEHEEFPTPDKSIEEIYLIDWKTPNYIKFADMAEEVLRDDYYRLTKRQLRRYKEYTPMQCLIRMFIAIKPVYKFYLSLLKNPKLKWSFLERQRQIREKEYRRITDIEQQHAHELTSEEEISKIIGRIKHALED